MARIRALRPGQAKQTLANRFGGLADRLRQIATDKGLRPYRVFLRWTQWSGTERGEGVETVLKTVEILPTPRVQSLDNMTFSFWHAGQIPVGSMRVDRISIAAFTEDILLGKSWPREWCDDHGHRHVEPIVAPLPGENPREVHIPEPYEFFYEVIEDGRGDDPAKRSKFRIMNRPMRRPGKVDWTIMLERISQDRTRDDKSAIGEGLEG